MPKGEVFEDTASMASQHDNLSSVGCLHTLNNFRSEHFQYRPQNSWQSKAKNRQKLCTLHLDLTTCFMVRSIGLLAFSIGSASWSFAYPMDLAKSLEDTRSKVFSHVCWKVGRGKETGDHGRSTNTNDQSPRSELLYMS
jgi:hypothetical protein